MRELATDYLDIWHLHVKNEPSEVTEELLDAQQAAKREGKIRFAGLSTHFNMDRMLAYLGKLNRIDVVLTTYNFAMRSVDSSMNSNIQAPRPDMTSAIRAARKSGLGLVAIKVMADGVSRVERGDRQFCVNYSDPSSRRNYNRNPGPIVAWQMDERALSGHSAHLETIFSENGKPHNATILPSVSIASALSPPA